MTRRSTSPRRWTSCASASLPRPWLLGWSFGTEVALKYGRDHDVEGVILLSPPLHRATDAEVVGVGAG